jgi:hypothetical protein
MFASEKTWRKRGWNDPITAIISPSVTATPSSL